MDTLGLIGVMFYPVAARLSSIDCSGAPLDMVTVVKQGHSSHNSYSISVTNYESERTTEFIRQQFMRWMVSRSPTVYFLPWSNATVLNLLSYAILRCSMRSMSSLVISFLVVFVQGSFQLSSAFKCLITKFPFDDPCLSLFLCSFSGSAA